MDKRQQQKDKKLREYIDSLSNEDLKPIPLEERMDVDIISWLEDEDSNQENINQE